jgi:hypothetical protein
LGEVLVLSEILNIKPPSFAVLRRKEARRYTFVNRSQTRYTDLCTESTDLLPVSVSVVVMNCDPFGYLSPPLYSRLSGSRIMGKKGKQEIRKEIRLGMAGTAETCVMESMERYDRVSGSRQ